MKGATFSANHYFEVLTDGQIEQIQEATLGVLASALHQWLRQPFR